MQALTLWENIIVVALAMGVVYWFRPGIKAALERSCMAKNEWSALFVPICLVVLLVVFLMMMV